MAWKGGQFLTQEVLLDQLTLYQPEGPDCAHSILLLALPALGTFLRHCSYAFLSKDSRITLHLGPKHPNRKR